MMAGLVRCGGWTMAEPPSDVDLKTLEDMMYDSFERLSREEKIRKIMLAGNAEFFLRMTEGNASESVAICREALTRYLRSA